MTHSLFHTAHPSCLRTGKHDPPASAYRGV
nr:MAG TPA: hypothetical protein [Caudoviricetes sp.]